MLIDFDLKPEKNVYLIGSQVLQLMNDDRNKKIDPKILYQKFNAAFESKISYNYFLYALDWLYLIDLIELTKNSEIKKCY